LIFCFSGTGNSLKAAKDVAAVLGDAEIVWMKGDSQVTGRYGRIGFVFPSYAGGVPKAVLDWIRALAIGPAASEYFFAVVTCGGAERGTLPMLRDALKEKEISLDYGRAVHTVGNYIAMYPLQPGVPEKLASADACMAVCAREIFEKSAVSIGKTKLGATLFYQAGNQYFKLNAKRLRVSEACTACGLCEKLCPTNSIRLQEGKPIITHKTCAQCMACVQWCPKQAIDAGKETIGRERYHHPDIHAQDMRK